MKYIIIGAGGTGGILGFYMTKAGKDVTLIARNAHLEAMQKQGLSVEKMWINETETIPVGAESMPAGIFICSHITFVMVYSFYFLFVGSRRNEFNSLWGR